MEDTNNHSPHFHPPCPEAISLFFHFCQTGNLSLPSMQSHFIELLSLSIHWDVPELREALQTVSNTESQDLKLLREALLNNADTSSSEILVRANFRTHLIEGNLKGFPLAVLARIFDIQQCHPEDVNCLFDFLLSCLDHFGRNASILFEGFDVSHLTVEQFKTLENRTDFDWCFVANSMRLKLSEFLNVVNLAHVKLSDAEKRFEDRVNNIEKRLEELYAGLANKNQEIEQKTQNLHQIVADLVEGPDEDQALKTLKTKIRFPRKHFLLPRNHRFQIQTDYTGDSQSLAFVDKRPDWPRYSGSPNGRLLALVPSNPKDPHQHFYFRDVKCRVISSVSAPDLVMDDHVEPSHFYFYLHPFHGGLNQLFWFDGQYLFEFCNGRVLTIDDNSDYRMRMCPYEGKPNQRFHLVLIPSSETD
jgi:hypothetical protein